MSDKFAVSDWHLGHENSWAKFKRADGSPLRPFSSTEEMNETIIENHNKIVKPHDVVYVLGDCVINKKYLDLVKRMNGKKRLVRGNHDIFDDKYYREVGFEKIYGVRVFVDKWIFSHIPLHPDCVTDRFRVNVHGHLHDNEVMKSYDFNDNSPFPDPRYLSVCVEKTDFKPLHFDEIESKIQQRWNECGYTPPANSGWGNGSMPE